MVHLPRNVRTRTMKNMLAAHTVAVVTSFWIGVANASDLITYRNDRLRFEITYLSTWERSDAPGGPVLFLTRKSANEFATISIEVSNVGEKGDTSLRTLMADPEVLVERLKGRFPDAELLESGETYLGGFPAYFISVIYSIKNLDFVWEIVAVQIICIKENRVFLVTFETSSATFDTMFDEFQTIMASFNFR